MEKELKELPQPKVSVLIAISNYWQSVFTLNKILSTCDVDIPIEIIATNNTGDVRVFDFLSNLLVDEKYSFVVNVGEMEHEEMNEATAINKMIPFAKGEHICVLDSNCILTQNWVSQLLNACEQCDNKAIVGIATTYEKKQLSSVLNKEDELMSVWKTENNGIEGVLLFHKNIIELVGNFNPRMKLAYSQNHFSQRVNCIEGYSSFYLYSEYRIQMNEFTPRTFEEKRELLEFKKPQEDEVSFSIQTMKQKNAYKVIY